MAGNLTDYAAGKLLSHTTGLVNWTAPSATYAALYTTTPTNSYAGVEVVGGAYIRQAVTWAAPVGRTIANSLAINFPMATDSDWGTVVAIGVVDSVIEGNLLWYGPTTPTLIAINGVFTIAVGALELEINP